MSTKSDVVYSIVVPALQEEFIIEKSLKQLASYLRDKSLMGVTEVVIVTADGNDNTPEIVRANQSLFPHFKFIQPGKRVGKGRDVQVGIQAAQGKYIIFTDADLATPVHHILPAFKLLQNGADVVIGHRELHKIHTGLRKLVSLAANTVSRVLIASMVADTQCGFKGFTKQSAKHLFGQQTIQGWAFDMEIIFLAQKSKYKIDVINIPDWTENKPEEHQLVGESNLKAAIKTFKEVLKIRLNDLRRLYN